MSGSIPLARPREGNARRVSRDSERGRRKLPAAAPPGAPRKSDCRAADPHSATTDAERAARHSGVVRKPGAGRHDRRPASG